MLYVAAIVLFLLSGCASAAPEKTSDNPTAQRLIGMTRTQIVECAGTPLREAPHGHGIVLRYYKEAPMLEESRGFLKGSTPGEHHGCWASLLIEQEQVTGVEFRTVPEGAGNQDDDCEAIFMACVH